MGPTRIRRFRQMCRDDLECRLTSHDRPYCRKSRRTVFAKSRPFKQKTSYMSESNRDFQRGSFDIYSPKSVDNLFRRSNCYTGHSPTRTAFLTNVPRRGPTQATSSTCDYFCKRPSVVCFFWSWWRS